MLRSRQRTCNKLTACSLDWFVLVLAFRSGFGLELEWGKSGCMPKEEKSGLDGLAKCAND